MKMQQYTKETKNSRYFLGKYDTSLDRGITNLRGKTLIEKLQLAPSRIPNIVGEIYMSGDCGSCPSCACIEADVQFLAVIEAPATIALMVIVGGIRLTS